MGPIRKPPAESARERILDAACELFTLQGIRGTGVDELIGRAGAAKATFYRHFHSKDDLVLAYLDRLHGKRTVAIADAVSCKAEGASGILGIFDSIFEAFKQDAKDGTSFVHVLMEMGAEHSLGAASMVFMEKVGAQFADLAREGGLGDAELFARRCLIVAKGAGVAAAQRNWDEFDQARHLVAGLIEHHAALGDDAPPRPPFGAVGGRWGQPDQPARPGQEAGGPPGREREPPIRHSP